MTADTGNPGIVIPRIVGRCMAKENGGPPIRPMAMTAILSRTKVTGALAGGCRTIMTVSTAPGDTLVIKPGAEKTRCGMTGRAIQIGLHMILGFTHGCVAIMTGCTVVHDTGMIKSGTHESGGNMTHPAILQGINVILGLANGKHAVVT